MNHSSMDDKRRLVPRWRSFHKASLKGELSTFKNGYEPDFIKNDSFLQKHLENWNEKKRAETAAEIVFHCITIGKPELAYDQSIFLKSIPSLTSELGLLVAEIITKKTTSHVLDIGISQLKDLKEQLYNEVHKLRKLLHQWPNSSIHWIEIARLYSALGEKEKAYKAIKIALQLDSNNRFVIRSAIRFFVHISDFDELAKVFLNYRPLYHDQWVLSAYISLHDFLKTRNLKIKSIRQLISSHGNKYTTELTGSLASLELESGAMKAAKKLFKSSIQFPNDNSLAQVAWAEKHIGRFANISQISVPFDYEAKTRQLFNNDNIEPSLQSCIQWMIDEPYSITPAIAGSHIASSFADNLDCARQFCEIGLNANPFDNTLLNNNAFCQAKMGNIEEAIESLKKISYVRKNSSLDISVRATTGLVMMRSDLIEQGRVAYIEAIKLATKLDMTENKAIAALFLAEEELRIGEKTREEIQNLISKNMPKTMSTYLKRLHKRITIALSIEFQKRQLINPFV